MKFIKLKLRDDKTIRINAEHITNYYSIVDIDERCINTLIELDTGSVVKVQEKVAWIDGEIGYQNFS